VIDHPAKIKRKTSELNCMIEQLDLSDIYRIFLSTTVEYFIFSAAYGAFSKLHHILALTNTKKLKYFLVIFSDHNGKN
jgi:hypothetical protein